MRLWRLRRPLLIVRQLLLRRRLEDAALVTSYSGPALIVDAVAFTSDDTDIVVADWRDYDLLAVTFLDSSGNAETYQCLVAVDSLDVNGKAQIAVEQNAQIEITATDDSDSLNFNFAGAVTGYPSTSDTISIWGLRVGVGAGGSGGGGGGGIDSVFIGCDINWTRNIGRPIVCSQSILPLRKRPSWRELKLEPM